MDPFQITLIIATLLCSLVGGFLIAFAIVVMPGIKSLSDREFLQTFQVIDRVIQKWTTSFHLPLDWFNHLFNSLGHTGHWRTGTGLFFMILAVFFYLLGVQLPTGIVNVPLNNKLQRIEIDELEQKTARENFESRWVRWNLIRTTFSILTSILLIILLIWHRYR